MKREEIGGWEVFFNQNALAACFDKGIKKPVRVNSVMMAFPVVL